MSSRVFGHLISFKCWIQTEACVIPSYHGILIKEAECTCSASYPEVVLWK